MLITKKKKYSHLNLICLNEKLGSSSEGNLTASNEAADASFSLKTE